MTVSVLLVIPIYSRYLEKCSLSIWIEILPFSTHYNDGMEGIEGDRGGRHSSPLKQTLDTQRSAAP